MNFSWSRWGDRMRLKATYDVYGGSEQRNGNHGGQSVWIEQRVSRALFLLFPAWASIRSIMSMRLLLPLVQRRLRLLREEARVSLTYAATSNSTSSRKRYWSSMASDIRAQWHSVTQEVDGKLQVRELDARDWDQQIEGLLDLSREIVIDDRSLARDYPSPSLRLQVLSFITPKII